MKCLCDCGLEAKPGNKYINGHNSRVNNPSCKPEVIMKIQQTKQSKKDGTWVAPVQVPCGCGCHQMTTPGSKYIQGHCPKSMDTRKKISDSNYKNGTYSKNSKRFKENHPLWNPKSVEKLVKSNWENGNYDRIRLRTIERNEVYGNPMSNPETIKKRMDTCRKNNSYLLVSIKLKEWKHTDEGIEHTKHFVDRSRLKCMDWDFYNRYGIKKSQYPYNPYFDNKLKQKVFEKWYNRCVITGMTNEEHIKLYGQSLHVHHWNYDKSTQDVYWLIPVCMPINEMANGDKEAWMSIFGGIVEEGKPLWL
jgi:hypothetical protein